MFTRVMLLLDLGLFWAMVVTAIMKLFGKISGKVPLVLLIAFVVVLIITFWYEFKNAPIYEDDPERFIKKDENDDLNNLPSKKDAE